MLTFPFLRIESSRFTTLPLCANGEFTFSYSSPLCQWRVHVLLLFLVVPMECSHFISLFFVRMGSSRFTTLPLCAYGEFMFYYSSTLRQWRVQVLLRFPFVLMKSSRFTILPLCSYGDFMFYYSSPLCQSRIHVELLFPFPIESLCFTTIPLCANVEFAFNYSSPLC